MYYYDVFSKDSLFFILNIMIQYTEDGEISEIGKNVQFLVGVLDTATIVNVITLPPNMEETIVHLMDRLM